MQKNIPGPAGKLFVGNLGEYDAKHYQKSMRKWFEEYGPIYQFKVFSRNVIILSGLDIMKKAFSVEDLNHRPHGYANKLRYGGNGALFANFSEKEKVFKEIVWTVMKDMEDDSVLTSLVDEEIDEYVASLNTGENVDINGSLFKSLSDQMAAKYLGTKATADSSTAMIDYLDALNEIYIEGREVKLTMFPFLRYIPGQIKRVVNNLISKQTRTVDLFMQEATKTYIKGQEHGLIHRIMTRKEQENSTRGQDFIKDDNINCLLLELIVSSITPLVASVCGPLLSGALHPDLQERIYQELRLDEPTYPLKRTDLPYFQAFVYENIRYFSFVAITFPRFVSKDTVVDGFLFKKGSSLLGSLFNLHHDDNIWGDPWVFRPERFLDDNGALLGVTEEPMKFLRVFGFDLSRDCKGQKIALGIVHKYLIKIFKTYKVLPPVGVDLPSPDPMEYETITVVYPPQFYCRFETRTGDTDSENGVTENIKL